MKVFYALLVLAALLITSTFANTEKLILQARSSSIDKECNPSPFYTQSLRPPFTKIQQSLIPFSRSHEGSSRQYHLDDLVDGSNYEIRISYPAITPADFNLNIVHACRNSDLNTLFYVLDVSAVYTDVSLIKGKELEPVVYDLVLENLYLGFLFYQVYKIVIAITGVIGLGLFVFMPLVKRLIKQDISNNKID